MHSVEAAKKFLQERVEAIPDSLMLKIVHVVSRIQIHNFLY